MKRLVNFLKQRWLISLLGILALVLLIWFAGPLLAFAGHEPLAGTLSRLLVILVLMVGWGLNRLRIQMQVNRATSQIMEGLVRTSPEADKRQAAALDQSAEEVAVLREQFEEAMEVLKKSSVKRGTGNLYELPWYIIIGPPGAGKTTALVHSGLDFPLAEHFGKGALRGVGGTRNCDWWFTNEAVLLDTAGRYVTQDSDQRVDSAAWEGFLGLLKQARRQRPINGVFVAISLSDLMLQSEQERDAHVHAIKQRIQELNKHLGIRFPVYVLFTKCDLVVGFIEFFDDLGREERAQVWGMTFPEPASNEDPVQDFGSEFEHLLKRVNERLLWRLSQERDGQRRALIYGFPQQMVALKETIETFLQDVFRSSRFQEPPLLRGVYFTSGTQEGTPIDRVMGALARTFGLDRQALPSFGGRGRSYFITQLLREVVFQESGLAGVDRRFERQRAWIQWGAYAGVLGVTALVALACSVSFVRNQAYVNRMDAHIDAYNKLVEAPLRSNRADFAEVLPRLDALRAAAHVYGEHADGAPLLMGLGLYQGEKLDGTAKKAYTREMNQVFLPRIKARLEEQLRAPTGDSDYQYETLKIYLMLGEPGRVDPDLLRLRMSLEWRDLFPTDADKQKRLQAHLDSLLEDEFGPVALDEQLVQDVRLQLEADSPRATGAEAFGTGIPGHG